MSGGAEGRPRGTVETLLGRVLLVCGVGGLAELRLPLPGSDPVPPEPVRDGAPIVLRRAAEELSEYFAGKRRRFTVPLAPAGGSPFTRAVWEALREIPYGETRSYRWVAERLGRPSACRAVGGANGRNPLPILVPCHRVVSSDGSLGGFASGSEAKRFLLELERRVASCPPP